jgi:HAD superfamily hydrolase (TIGR01509 family)
MVVIEAVLFDWGQTLVHFEWDDELVVAAHHAALGKDDPEFTARWREAVFGDHGHRPYEELLRDLGVADPAAFIDAEFAAWNPARTVLASGQALLESLRSRGVKTGVVANAWPDPPRIVRAQAEELGLAAYLDVFVLAQEVGVRKPDPAIFMRALDELGVEPENAMFVGDSLPMDVQGAANVGMTTVQALWFVADDTPAAVEPDFMAFTPMDVLNAVLRLAP